MKTETEPKENKTMIDASGEAVPLKYVPKYDRLRDAKVRRVRARWERAQADVRALVADTLGALGDIMTAREAETGAAPADKGNFSVCSFDGNTRVELAQRYSITLDDTVKTARDMMLSHCLDAIEAAKSAELADIAELVKAAFEPTRGGGLSVAKVMQLCRVNVKAEKWRKAVAILLDSIHVEKGKCYVYVSMRKSKQDDWEGIDISVPANWPAESPIDPTPAEAEESGQ